MSPGAKPSPRKPNWHCLPNLDIIFKFGTMEIFSSLLPFPLEHQNIPDGYIIKFHPPNEPPTVSAPPTHCCWHCLHIFTSAPNPCTTALPYYTPTLISGTPSISTILPAQPNNPMLIYRKVTRPGIEPRTFWTYTRCSNQLSYSALEFNRPILYLCNCQSQDTYSARHI